MLTMPRWGRLPGLLVAFPEDSRTGRQRVPPVESSNSGRITPLRRASFKLVDVHLEKKPDRDEQKSGVIRHDYYFSLHETGSRVPEPGLELRFGVGADG